MSVNVAADLRKFNVSRPDGEGILRRCSTHLDWSLQLKQYWLRNEDLSRFRAKIANLCFQQLYLFAWSASSHLQQAVDDRVQIYLVLVGHGCGPTSGAGRNGNVGATVERSPNECMMDVTKVGISSDTGASF